MFLCFILKQILGLFSSVTAIRILRSGSDWVVSPHFLYICALTTCKVIIVNIKRCSSLSCSRLNRQRGPTYCGYLTLCKSFRSKGGEVLLSDRSGHIDGHHYDILCKTFESNHSRVLQIDEIYFFINVLPTFEIITFLKISPTVDLQVCFHAMTPPSPMLTTLRGVGCINLGLSHLSCFSLFPLLVSVKTIKLVTLYT